MSRKEARSVVAIDMSFNIDVGVVINDSLLSQGRRGRSITTVM